jgi:hypothetical protein
MKRINEILRALLESDDDDFDLKDLSAPDEAGAEFTKNQMLDQAIERKFKHLGLCCTGTFQHTNPQGETYIYGQFGSREPRRVMATLLYQHPTHGWQLVESVEDEDDIKDILPDYVEKRYLPLGTISHATMHEEDLIPAFLDALESVAPQEAEELRQNYTEEIAQSDPEFCWETLISALEEHTPPYTYVGSHPGDGSDYGVWVATEALDDDLRYEDTDKLQSMVQGERMPKGSQYVVVTNQNGDYVALLDGLTGKTIWNE